MSTAVVHDEQAIIRQVGDSRGYLIRGGRVQQLTKEHSLVQAMLDAGQLTEERAAHSPLRHVILHALGADDQLQPQLSFVDLQRGDCVLLCSDGLSNKVGDVEVHDIVREIASARLARDSLLSPMNVAAKTILH